MELKEFKIVKNRQRPDFCYEYVKYNSDKTEKYSLFTMDGAKTFLASVTSMNGLGKLVVTDYSQKFNSKEDALNGIIDFKLKKIS